MFGLLLATGAAAPAPIADPPATIANASDTAGGATEIEPRDRQIAASYRMTYVQHSSGRRVG